MTDIKTKLRKQAEEKASQSPENIDALSPAEIRQTLHELRVHQIELEMQNVELHQTQGKLEASRARYFDLYDMAPVGYCTLSEMGLILETNFIVATLLSVTRHELVKRSFSRFIMKDDQDIFYLHSKQIFSAHSSGSGQAGEPQACELRMLKKDGTAFWAHLAMTAAQDENGTPVCRVALSDITDRKRAEEEIKQNELRLRSLLDILQHPSDTIQDFLDYALGQAILLTKSKIGYIYHYHEDRQEFVLNTWSKDVMAACAVANPQTCYELDKTGIWGEAVRQRCPIIVNDFQAAHHLKKGYPEGHVQLLKFLTVPIFRGVNIVGVVGVANKETDYKETDIIQVSLLMEAVWKVTERKRAKEDLRESNELFSLFMRHSPFYTYIKEVTPTRSIVLQASDNFQEMIGIPGSEMVGKTVEELFPPEFAAKITADDWAVVSRGDILSLEEELNGRSYTTTKFPIVRGDKNLLAGYTIDITERKRAEEEKAKLEIQLLQTHKMEAIGTLAGGIAHDFNNILAAMIGYTELSLAEDKKEIQHQYLQETLKGAERAKDLVKQILTFSRQDSREKKPLDIKLLLKEAVKFLRASMPTTIAFRQHFTNEPCNILADYTQVYQVIMNLCTNASYAMKQAGGILTLELSTLELAKSEILHHPGLKPGPYIKLTVSDTGCGIDSAFIQRIFDPFFTTKTKDEGTGLGLSVAYGIVKSHDGVINVYSELGKGASFSVYLPRIIHEAVTIGDISKTVIGGTEQILFVDDEPALVDIGTLTLSSLGYKVTGVTSSNEALDLFRAEPDRFDLVITDMTLPKMTGIELSREILQIRPDMPVILCSGLRDAQTEEQVKSLGIKAYCTKPLTRKDLSRVVRDTLDGYKNPLLQ